jgi:hypothetical protein
MQQSLVHARARTRAAQRSLPGVRPLHLHYSNDDAQHELHLPKEATEGTAAGYAGELRDKPLAGHHQHLPQPVHGRTM